MLFILIFAILTVLCLVARNKWRRDSWEIRWDMAAILSGIASVIFLVVTLCIYFGTIDDYAKLKAYPTVEKIIVESIQATSQSIVDIKRDPLTPDAESLLSGMGIDVANFKHSTQTADRVNDLKNIRMWYFQTTERYSLLTSNLITRSFFPPLPADLRKK